MSTIEQTCGMCKYGKSVPNNLLQKICQGGPPQMVLVPVPGGAKLESMWPHVLATQEACGLFKPKLTLVGGSNAGAVA